MSDLGTIDIIIHGANIVALVTGLIGLLKIVVPASLSVRDSLRDTASMLGDLKEKTKDHEERLRFVEKYVGPERRAVERT